MRNDKQRAVALRRRGLSYNAIGRKLLVPKSTLSEWFSGLVWSEALKRDLTRKAFAKVYPQLRAMSKARAAMWEEWRESARRGAVNEFSEFVKDRLFIAGILLYWGEGDRNPRNAVRLANTDPRMIAIFSRFLRKYCLSGGHKMKISLVIYPDLSAERCQSYWSKVSGISEVDFSKTQIIQGRHPVKRLSYGICYIGVNSRQIKEKILKWIELFARQYTKITRV